MPKGNWLKNNPEKNPNPKKECPDVEKLKFLYLKKRIGSHKIAKEFEVTQRLVMLWLKRNNIKTRSYSDASKLSLNGFKEEEKHLNWKGNNVGYQALHTWVRKHKGTPQKCEHCGRTDKKKYEWANIDHSYKRNLDDWIRLCTKCHREYDKTA